jgi:starch-binding outer membrane protein, SusD/RagB family
MKQYTSIKTLLLLSFVLVLTNSCSDILQTENENEIESSEAYRTSADADNAILGIYSKFMGLVDRVIVLEELRADLMDITTNSTTDLIAINNHTATSSNGWCDTAPFYEVILNCNDALYHFDAMLADGRLSKAQYNYRYADVMTVRCWLYLELAIHFGGIKYVTDPLLTVDDLNDSDNFPKYAFSEIIQKLIFEMNALPSLSLSSDSPLYSATTDGYLMRMYFLNKKIMLGDLYLWDNQYVNAATQYQSFWEESENQYFSGTKYLAYKLDGSVWNASKEPRFQVCYYRDKSADLGAFRNKWKEIFYRGSTDSEEQREMITMMSYDADFAPEYPLIKLFANTGKGEYLIKPSTWAVDSLWGTQEQRDNGFLGDGRGDVSSFEYVNGQAVVIKYLYNYYSTTTDANKTIQLNYSSFADTKYTKNGKWFLYRAGLLHLRFAEAVNRAGYPDIAYALINNGIGTNYDWVMDDGISYRADKSGVQYTGYRPVSDNVASVPYSAPFYLDARNNSDPYTYYRSPWYLNYGVRLRGFVANVQKSNWVKTKADSIQWMEQVIVNEGALECGFEGHRWGDLLRVAMRKNAEDGTGNAFLNNALSGKFKLSAGVAPTLSPNNWFLPQKE